VKRCLANVVNMAVKRHGAVQGDTQTADTFGYRNVDVAEWNGASRTLLPAPCTGPDDSRFGLIWVKG